MKDSTSPLKVAIINKSDSTGGAAVVSLRLLDALHASGIDARMFVTERLSGSDHVYLAASPRRYKLPFLTERLNIFLRNGLRRDTLFKIDTATSGLPLHKIPFIKEADVVCLNWVNQGMLSLSGVEKILEMGKPLVWTMHDMWNFTGICHHAGECTRYRRECGCCPLLNSSNPNDMSHSTWSRKKSLYRRYQDKIHFVAVSNWLALKAKESSLIGENANLHVIPNAFPIPKDPISEKKHQSNNALANEEGEFRVVMGAARLDDPIKDFPTLIRATQILRDKYPERAEKVRLVTFGAIRNPELFSQLGVKHTDMGRIDGADKIRRLYESCDAVVSSSEYETLPGTLVEGQVYGCVPIAFDRGGQRDIVDPGVTGFLFPRTDSAEQNARYIAEGIIQAMDATSTPQAREQLRTLMFESARCKFSASTIASQYSALFAQIMEKA